MTNSLYRHKNLLTHKCGSTTQRHAESGACHAASLRLCPGVMWHRHHSSHLKDQNTSWCCQTADKTLSCFWVMLATSHSVQHELEVCLLPPYEDGWLSLTVCWHDGAAERGRKCAVCTISIPPAPQPHSPTATLPLSSRPWPAQWTGDTCNRGSLPNVFYL